MKLKRLFPFLLAIVCLCTLCACSGSGFYNDYTSIKKHTEPSAVTSTEPASEPAESPVVTNRTELRGAVLSFIRSWTEHGTIIVSDYHGALSNDIADALYYATKEDPIGAYAVDYADAELTGDAGSGTISVNIVLRRSASEIDSILVVSDTDAALRRIEQALANYDSSLTMRIRSYQEVDFDLWFRNYCLHHPEIVIEIPEFSSAVYPDAGDTRIVELHFSYLQSKEALRSQLSVTNTLLSSGSSYIGSVSDNRAALQSLWRFMTSRFTYTYPAEISSTPVYSLLADGIAGSYPFASITGYECASINLPCWIVTGSRNGEPWYWNIVELDGIYYHMDLMRSQTDGDTELFLMTEDEARREGYVWEESAYPMNAVPEPPTVVSAPTFGSKTETHEPEPEPTEPDPSESTEPSDNPLDTEPGVETP